MIRLWRNHRIALTGFVLATLVTLFFLFRLAVQTVYWADPAHQHLAPQPWMTVGYVARSWGLDPRDLVEAAGLSPPRGRLHKPLTLAQVAAQRGMSVAALIADLQHAIRDLQAPGAQD